MDLLAGDVELTEFEAIDVQTIKGVREGANGFPILMMKGLAPVAEPPADDAAEAEPEFDHAAALAAVKAIVGRKVDESPDIAGGTAVLAQIADLIIAEAQELKAGNAGEICDIQQLACAAEMIWCWRTGEEAVASGSVQPATALMQSAAESYSNPEFLNYLQGVVEEAAERYAAKADMSTSSINDLPDSAFAYIEPGGTKDADGKTTPRSLRHFPVHDEAHARNALSRAPQSPFGDKAMPKIKAAAKKFGIDSDDDTAKSQIAPEVTTVDTVTQETGGLTKAVEDAIAKATAPLQERIQSLDAELAKVKATPVPSGMVLSRNVQVKTPGGVANDDLLAKAALYRQKAADATAPSDREAYLALARETEQEARTKSA